MIFNIMPESILNLKELRADEFWLEPEGVSCCQQCKEFAGHEK